MLQIEDRTLLEATAKHALDFILSHCNDTQFCAISGFLINGMRELCEEEQREFHGPSQIAPGPVYPSLSSPPTLHQMQAEELLRNTVAQEMQRQTAMNDRDQMAEARFTPLSISRNEPGGGVTSA